MHKIAIIPGLALGLAAAHANAQAALLSNDQLAGFSIIIGSPPEAQDATRKLVPVATTVLPPIPLIPAAPPTPARPPEAAVPARIIAAASPAAAAGGGDRVAANTAPGSVAPGNASPAGTAPARKLLVHIHPSTELEIDSGALQDARIDASGDEVVFHVDGNAISIKAHGITGISFAP